MNLHRLAPLTLSLVMFAMPAIAQQAADKVVPEAASGVDAKRLVHAEKQMVVAAHPLAAEAGRDILRAGGSAADALVAVQTVLGLVEPQSSGLGAAPASCHGATLWRRRSNWPIRDLRSRPGSTR